MTLVHSCPVFEIANSPHVHFNYYDHNWSRSILLANCRVDRHESSRIEAFQWSLSKSNGLPKCGGTLAMETSRTHKQKTSFFFLFIKQR